MLSLMRRIYRHISVDIVFNEEESDDECMQVKRAWQGRAGQGRAGQDRTGQDRTGQDRTGQDRTGQDRAGQGRTGQDRAGYSEKENGVELDE